MRRLFAVAGSLAFAGLSLSAIMPDLAEASESVTLGADCFLLCPFQSQTPQAILQQIQQGFLKEHKYTKITIDEYPDEWRKADELVVVGTVTTLEGEPVGGMEVRVYLNRTKAERGSYVGSTTTAENGSWEFRRTVPREVVAGPYQLVAEAVEDDRGRVIYHGSWSDPEVDLWTGTTLEAKGEWVDGGWSATAKLLDDGGLTIANAPLEVVVDGAPARLVTNRDGEVTVRGPFPPPETIRVSYAGDAYHAASEAVAEFPPAPLVLDGDVLRVTPGAVPVLHGRTLPDLPVVADGVATVSDATGRFTIELLPRDSPGRSVFEVRAATASRLVTLAVGYPVALEVARHGLPVYGATFEVRARTPAGPAADVPVLVEVEGGPALRLVTDADGRAEGRIPLSRSGSYGLVATVDEVPWLPADARTDVRVLTASDLVLPLLGALAASIGALAGALLRHATRPRATLALEAPARALSEEPLTVVVRLTDATGPVTLRAGRVRLAGMARDGEVRFLLLAPPPGALTIEAAVPATWHRRGRRLRATVVCRTYAQALLEAGHEDLAIAARWGPPDGRRAAWIGGGSPA